MATAEDVQEQPPTSTESSQQTEGKQTDQKPLQAVAGVTAPESREANIRTVWPSVTAANPALANLGAALIRSRVLAPLAWLLMAPLYFMKILPFLAKRYTLTNRRLMIQRGLRGKSSQEAALADIDDVRLAEGSYNSFFKAGTLEIVKGGQVVLTLIGVPEPGSFRHSILNAVIAWVPGKSQVLPMIPASASSAQDDKKQSQKG